MLSGEWVSGYQGGGQGVVKAWCGVEWWYGIVKDGKRTMEVVMKKTVQSQKR